MTRIVIQAAAANDKGRIRTNNEDNFYLNGILMQLERMDEGAFVSGVCKEKVQIYAVCDGMGGIDAGEEASYRAVRTLAEKKREHAALLSEGALTHLLRGISEEICAEAQRRGGRSGTTIAMLLTDGERLLLANVGDSRIYRLREQEFSQISVDHTRVQRMVSMGMITPAQARTDPSRHMISQYLGMSGEIKVSPSIIRADRIRKGDVYLLCSDGLTDMVEDGQIRAILMTYENPPDAAGELLQAAKKGGGRDNITVMVLRIAQIFQGEERTKLWSRRIYRALTGAQILTGSGILLIALDLLYFLFHR